MAKKHIAALGAAALVVTLAGCAGGGTSGGTEGEVTGDITVLTNRTDLVDTDFVDYKAAFEEKYPGTNVTFEAITDYEGEVTTRLSTNDYGDVLGIPASVQFDQLSQFFEPLGEVDELKETYRFIDKAAYDGTAYGLPTFGNTIGVLYNTRIWEEAGVTELPTTPEEFIADLQLIADNTDAIPYYTNYADGWPLSQFQGLRGFTGDPETANEMAEEDAPWTEGDEQYIIDSTLYDVVEAGLNEPDPLTTNWEESKALIATGEAATAVLGSWAIVQFKQAAEDAGIDPAEIGYMPFPYREGDTAYAQIGGDFSNAININSDNKATAKAWIEWFATESGFAEAQGGISPLVDGENPTSLSEFDEAGVEYLELTPAPAEEATLLQDIYNGAEIDLFGQIYRQKLVDIARGAAEGDKASYFEELNTKWAESRADVTS